MEMNLTTQNFSSTKMTFLSLGQILKEKEWATPREIKKTLELQKRLGKAKLGEIIGFYNKIPMDVINNAITSHKNGTKKNQPSFKIGEILIHSNLVSKRQVDDALSIQSDSKRKQLGALLVKHGIVSENRVLRALGFKFGLEFIDLEAIFPREKVLNSISSDVVKKLNIFPVDDDNGELIVATARPEKHLSLVSDLSFNASKRVRMVIAPAAQINKAIEDYYFYNKKPQTVKIQDYSLDDIISEIPTDDLVIEEHQAEEISIRENDSVVIKLLNKILIDAYQQDASDIHIESGSDILPLSVRYRVDGLFKPGFKIPKLYNRALISRLKIISTLDIGERRKPQSGKIVFRIYGKKLEFRVEIIPINSGYEDAVIRVLPDPKPLSLKAMDFSPANLESFRKILTKPFGIILCVGPTGSGKTTTLHSALGHINKQNRKIWTAEDPVEITQDGIRQVQVNPKIGFTFAEALRSFLRADPDVIMIGEMRDKETAKIAVEASLTGHLVFSTLHTNSAAETLVRLLEMDIEAFNFADALQGVLAQRLVRRLCNNCKQSYNPSEEEYADLRNAYGADFFDSDILEKYSKKTRLMRRKGCPACEGSGYKFRMAVHEMLIGTSKIKYGIKENLPSEELEKIALSEGMRTLKMDGIHKIFLGATDIIQIKSVCF